MLKVTVSSGRCEAVSLLGPHPALLSGISSLPPSLSYPFLLAEQLVEAAVLMKNLINARR